MTDGSLGAWGSRHRARALEHGAAEDELSLLVWRFPEPLLVVTSAPLGGGMGQRDWVLNAQVPHTYGRVDPETHLAELASQRGLAGAGVGMLTAVDVRAVSAR